MHDCQKYREAWVVGITEDLGDCRDCRSFCEEAAQELDALSRPAEPFLHAALAESRSASLNARSTNKVLPVHS